MTAAAEQDMAGSPYGPRGAEGLASLDEKSKQTVGEGVIPQLLMELLIIVDLFGDAGSHWQGFQQRPLPAGCAVPKASGCCLPVGCTGDQAQAPLGTAQCHSAQQLHKDQRPHQALEQIPEQAWQPCSTIRTPSERENQCTGSGTASRLWSTGYSPA